MTPESTVIAELQPLLDALVEDHITPDQLKRLEELVLMHPAAEAHYIRFMSFYADLIGHVAGLPEPNAKLTPEPAPARAALNSPKGSAPGSVAVSAAEPRAAETAALPGTAKTQPDGHRLRKMIAWLVVIGTLATLAGSQVYGWRSRQSDLKDKEVALKVCADELARVQAEQDAAQKESRKHVDAALVAEGKLIEEFRAAHERARKAIEEKEFTVRLTGPTHIQPGAPNKWQIETLRHGAVGRPKKMDVIVKDAKDVELVRQTHNQPVGAATLELSAAFWDKVKPGSDLFLEVVAHTDDDRTSVLAERLPLARPMFVTHLVTDKPLYKPGETVRFRSLTLDRFSLRPPENDLHLIFKLRDPADAVVPLDTGNGRLLRDLQPVLGPDQKPLRGIGVGEYALSPDAPGGEYKLDLFELSSETGKEVLLETRKFIVNRYVPDTFEKKLEFDGKSYGPGEYVQARIEVSRTAGGPMKDARATVVATSEGKTFHEQKDAKFAVVTEASGTKVFLDVRFALPASVFEKAAKDAPPSATLSVNIQDGSDAEAIVRPIPLVTKTLRVAFFPEGGEMIEGAPGRVYFMVRSDINKPADLKGIITDGTNTIAVVSTLTDAQNPGVNRGHGVFTLTPKAGVKYFLKIASPVGITEPTKDGYPLPVAKADGVALRALDAVTKRGAAIRLQLQTARGPKTLHVGAYARGRLIAQQRIELEANNPAVVSLNGDEAAGGVTRITVFEEKTDGSGRVALVPIAERLVFRESGEHLILKANPDKARYSPSDKVRLELSAVTEKDAPAPAVLLVGVVNQSVITMADNKNDRLLPTHFLLSGEVKNSADLEHADFLLTDHAQAGVALDLLLGTQGWRRFAEQDVSPPTPADRPDVDKMLVAHGQRPSAPLELFKLEEQRLLAEFRPRLELARLTVAAKESEWSAIPGAVVTKLAEARVAVSVAESHKKEAVAAVERFNERFKSLIPSRESAAFVVALIVLAGLFMMMLKETATKPAGEGAPYIAVAFSVVVCVAVLGMIQTLGTNANSTFSFVGSSIRPPAGDRGEGLVGSRAPMAAPAEPMFEPAPPPPAAPKPPPRRLDQNNGRPFGFQNDSIRPIDLSKPISKIAKKPGAGLQGDKARVGREFDPDPAGRNRANNRGRVPMMPPLRDGVPPYVIHMPKGLLVEVEEAITPFVVREYAHERDPALGEVRADFTETVFWHPVLVLPGSGKATVEFQLSDDIARYQVLVAGHTLDGRIGAITKTVEARKPFSIDPKLPLEISHTDTVDVPVRVTNDSDVRRNVAFTTTPNGFRAAGPLQEIIDLQPNGKGRKILRLNADKLQGDASLLVEGTSIPVAEKDSIIRTIRIVPDGFPCVGSFSDMLEKGRARGTITLPKDVVPSSLRVRLEVYPTSMADLVKGLDGLLREPHGCFEQTSTTNYPNTLILDYLNQSNQVNPEAARRAKELLTRGYGRLVSYECPDTPTKAKQGFEWFGAADNQHEALTAYGLLQFKDMSRVHPVDPQLIKRTQEFLLSRKDGTGGFRRNARALDGFGGAPKHTTDAYIVWALVESDPDNTENMDLAKEIATLKAEALNENSTGGKDAYFVALVANIMLQRGEREAAHKLLDRLKDKHVKGGAVTGAVTSITRSGGRDLEIEATAIALLGWLRANDPSYATTIKEATRWISQQRGGYGGFGSTQSTIMALKALTLFAKKAAHPAEAGELRVMVGGKAIGTRRFTEQDVEVIGLDLPNPEAALTLGGRTEVEIVTDAKQPYPFALGYTYTTLTPVSAEKRAVQLSTRLSKTDAAEGETVPLAVTLENRQNKGQGMAVAVIGIPAGMKVPTDLKQLTDLREKGRIAYFETRGRELVLYWRELAPNQKIAVTVDLVCDVPGTYRGPASRAYLYYDADHKHWVEPLSVRIAPLATEPAN